eukprot:Skav216247  [mRNA]  locus=scaffold20:89010:95933:+ [translate_table: standard]
MSSRPESNWVSREEFDTLCGEVASLIAEVANLTSRLAELEGEPGFEVVTSATASTAAAPSAPSASADRIPAERSVIAAEIGGWIRRALRGERRGLSGREKIALQSRIYLIFKDLHGAVHNPPLCFELWREAKVHCTVGGHAANDSVFVGLPSKAEARIVVATDHVPGSFAPVSNMVSLWNSVLRWMSATPSPFAAFLKSLPRLQPSDTEVTAPALWPMPPPYPAQWLPGAAMEDAAPFPVQARRKAINACVMALNWLHLKKPSSAPQEIALGRPLRPQQKAAVRRLEKFFVEVSLDGYVGPKEMGRTAAKFESLDELVSKLQEEVSKLEPEKYQRSFTHNSARSGRVGHFEKPVGEVVGRLKTSLPAEAKCLQANRLSLPKDPPLFDPTSFLQEPYLQMYRDPASLASPVEEGAQLPRVRVHGSAQQAWSFVKFLDSHHRLYLASEKKIRPGLLCGAFALGKDAASDRLIVDARLPNSVEPTMTEWVKTLGSVQALLQLELSSHSCLRFSGTDLKDYYYSYKVSSARSRRNALRLPLQPAQVQHLSAFRAELLEDQLCYPCLRTMAMGDNNAVELGQLCHVHIGLQSQVFSPSELLTIHGRAPRSQVAAGIIIDDVLFAEEMGRDEAMLVADGTHLTEGARRLHGLCEEYVSKGLTPHPKKTFQDEVETDIWGAHLNGDSGIFRPAACRLVPLMNVTVQVAKLGICTVAMMEVLCGAWISVLQFRRRMLCLLDVCYAVQTGREQEELLRLPPAAVAELWTLVALAPLAATDVRAKSLPSVFLSDASEDAVAAVHTKVSFALAKELQRHCLSRGAWSRLLSPWQVWLKRHSKLDAGDELPDGVPLVCHPLWVALAEALQYKLQYMFHVRKKRHINLLELQGILEVERRLAAAHGDFRYVLAADSQVALAALVKGRSSSPRLNGMLQESLATLLGSGGYGNYGYLPSRVNVADDPTRGQPIRKASVDPPEWLQSALQGDFSRLDAWLVSVGFSPLQIAELPCTDDVGTVSMQAQQDMLHELRRVAKPERLEVFDRKLEENQKNSREHAELDSQTKIEEKSPKRIINVNRERASDNSVASKEVAPPLSTHAHTYIPKHEEAVLPPPSLKIEENHRSPLLSAEALQLLHALDPEQVLLPGGRRARSKEELRGLTRAGFLDLYSGKAGVARELSRKYRVWVVTFDFDHGCHQDLLDSKTQKNVLRMLEHHLFLGVGAAPECASFSRAVCPAVRSALHPEGLDGITQNMQVKVERGNRHAEFCAVIVARAAALKIAYWLENPDGSFLWLQPDYVLRKIGSLEGSYRFDMCRYGARWRKRTRVATNTVLAGCRELCRGQHSHQRLRGRSNAHKCSWTKLAQVYPQQLCRDIATGMALRANLVDPAAAHFSVASCAKCSNARIGEASHPGPRVRRREPQRAPSELLNAALVEDTTLHLQDQVWKRFRRWLHSHLSARTCEQLFYCSPLAGKVLERYGVHLFAIGAGLYELRHLLVLIQQQKPDVRVYLGPAWLLVNKWEQVRPLTHRTPLPEVLYKAMVAVAMCWRWTRWSAALIAGFQGMTRIGEALGACRADLLLPSDNFDEALSVAFLKIQKPKTRRRGKGRVQHARIEQPAEVAFLERHIAPLDPAAKLFPLSPAAFRSRWEKVLESLKVPVLKRPTPASVRGGGAIAAYRRGKPIQDLLWAMRISSQPTLESYLQELAADNFLLKLPEDAKLKIRQAAAMYSIMIAQ